MVYEWVNGIIELCYYVMFAKVPLLIGMQGIFLSINTEDEDTCKYYGYDNFVFRIIGTENMCSVYEY